MAWRRLVVLGLTGCATTAGLWGAGRVLALDSLGPLDIAILAVLACLFSWTTFWFLIAVAGFISPASGGSGLGIDTAAPPPTLKQRTAILAPIYNEQTHLVFARLQAIQESVQQTGRGGQFDLFVLSDSTDPEVQAAERQAFLRLRRRALGDVSVFYRRRASNQGRKVGNIADWVRRFGGGYACMIVLDADSLMTGHSMVHLAAAMERNLDVGMIQTLPLIVNRASLFGRTLQFAGRLYGPILGRGMAWWSGAEGNYWGHNAIVRVKAFAAHAGLPKMGGVKPFGGDILSHDFVEAALIRRAGYAVHLAPEVDGSYEECPPTLDALMTRDRRWCQGNVQHLGLLGARGLHWINRLHLLNGALAYGAAPLWLALLCMSILLKLRPELGMGSWPQTSTLGLLAAHDDLAAMRWIFTTSMVFLLAPKLLAYISAMRDARLRRAFGGPLRALAGVGIETLISALIAPIMMLSQTQALAEVVLGRDSGWATQARTEDGVTLTEAARWHGWHVMVGLGMSVAALNASTATFVWIAPVVLGLLLSVPLSAAISRRDLGQLAQRSRMLVSPEESSPPPILLRANRLALDYARLVTVRAQREKAARTAPPPRTGVIWGHDVLGVDIGALAGEGAAQWLPSAATWTLGPGRAWP